MWLWLLAIVAVGSFVTLLFYLDQYDKGHLSDDHVENLRQLFIQPAPVASGNQKPDASKKVTQKPKTKYDFYSLLPSMEVVIPDREVAVRDDEVPQDAPQDAPHETPRHSPAQQVKPEQGGKVAIQYILQAGSFRDDQQAEKLKAGLALLGIKSVIEKVSIKDSGQWHRVRIGPFTAMREIDKVRSRMRDNNIEPILLKDKS